MRTVDTHLPFPVPCLLYNAVCHSGIIALYHQHAATPFLGKNISEEFLMQSSTQNRHVVTPNPVLRSPPVCFQLF